jgi:hypothetical protein
VYCEYVIENNRRIDLFIETVNFTIPVEVKIFAGDQDSQCFDYHKLARGADLYFLTLDRRLPAEESAEGLTAVLDDGEISGYQGVRLISFRDEILNWLNNCLSRLETIKIAPIREIMLQLKDVILNLTGQKEGDEEMEIVNTITSSAENMKSALDIAGALPEAKTAVMLNLFCELRKLFEEGGKTIWDWETCEDAINQFYKTRKQSDVFFSINIKSVTDNHNAVLFIGLVDWLYFGFSVVEPDENGNYCKYKDIKWLKKNNPEICNSFLNAIINVCGDNSLPSDEMSSTTLYENYLCDDLGDFYDFKSFSEPCIELASNCKEHAKKIHSLLDGYISTIHMNLE